MRTIEEKIIDTTKQAIYLAFAGCKNLSCRDSVSRNGGTVKIFLHGNNIFTVDNIYNMNEKSFSFSFCGWQTNTTKSRLNALLSNFCNFSIYQKNYKLYTISRNEELNGMEIDCLKTYIVKNGVIEQA